MDNKMNNKINDEIQWMNETMSRAAWPLPSADLHDRIMAGAEQTNGLSFGFRRPYLNSVGLKLSALALAAMIAGFWVGTLGQPLPAANADLAYNASPYYTGSGIMLAGLYAGTE